MSRRTTVQVHLNWLKTESEENEDQRGCQKAKNSRQSTVETDEDGDSIRPIGRVFCLVGAHCWSTLVKISGVVDVRQPVVDEQIRHEMLD